MKKLLLTAMAAVLSLGASAATYTITDPDLTGFTIGTYNNGDKEEGTLSGTLKGDGVEFKVVIYQNGSSTKVDGITAANAKGQLRWYKGMKMTITAPNGMNMTKIVFTTATGNKATTFTATAGTVSTLESTAADQEITWTYDAGVNEFEGTSTDGQLRTNKLVITAESGSSSDTRLDAGLSFPEGKYTITEGETFTAPVLTKATTAAVTYSSDKEEVAKVDATTGAVTVVGVGSARITATAEANAQYKAGSASYLLTVNPKPQVVASIAEFKALCVGSGTYPTVIINAPVTVTYQNGSYLFVKDATGTLEIYGTTGQTYNNGDVIPAGIKGKAQLYKNYVYEMSSIDATTFAPSTSTAAAAPAEITVGAITPEMCNDYVLLKNVTVTAGEGKNYVISDEEGDEVALYNQFTDETKYNVVEVTTGDNLNVYAIVTYYSAVQLYPVKVEKADGISNVSIDENAPVEFFNLQGVRVANPENGIFIRRQGSNVSKVYVK